MNFTRQEAKLIQRFRRQNQQWRWMRWLVLVLGVLSAALCAVFGYFLNGLIGESEAGHFAGQQVFFIVLFWTKCCFYFFFGIWCLMTVFLKWRGDVNRTLLLRLLDAQQEVV